MYIATAVHVLDLVLDPATLSSTMVVLVVLPQVHVRVRVAGAAEASLRAGGNGKAARSMQQSSTTWEVVAAGELSRRKLRGSSPAWHEVVILLLRVVADIFFFSIQPPQQHETYRNSPRFT